VQAWIAACKKCQQFKYAQPKKNGLLQPIRVTYPFEVVGIDLVGPLPTSKQGNKYLLVAVDLFTSWVEAQATADMTTATISKAILITVIARHGCPNRIFTDQGSQFKAGHYRQFCELFRIERAESTAYHHQTNEKVEQFVRFLKTALATKISLTQRDWDEHLTSCLFIYRVCLNRILQDTPFFLLYGRDAVLPQDLFAPLKGGYRKIAEEDVEVYKELKVRTLKEA
jgi:transposase InsO family protein